MKKVYSDAKYNYYIGTDEEGKRVYNILPKWRLRFTGKVTGYYDRAYIEAAKGRKFPEEVL